MSNVYSKTPLDLVERTYKKLIENLESIRQRIDRPLTLSEKILYGHSSKPGEIDLLTAGPPCQPFSKSGYWHQGETLRLNDQRADTIGKFLELISKIRPKSILFENVPAICL